MPSSRLEDEIDKWSKAANDLQRKLSKKQAENGRLRESLEKKNDDCEKLEEEIVHKDAQISDLEHQIVLKSMELTHLKDMFDSQDEEERQDKAALQSHELASKCAEINRLAVELENQKSENVTLKEENKVLKDDNRELVERLETSVASLKRMGEDREKNQRLMLRMSDIIRTLQSVSIDFESACGDDDENVGSPQELAAVNIKRKIEAMDNERYALAEACQKLRDENIQKDQTIAALEASFHSLNCTRQDNPSFSSTVGESSDTETDRNTSFESSGTPLSLDTAILNREQEKAAVQKSRTHGSDASSFSTLEPPHVPVEQFEAVQRDYEDAVERIVKLTGDLNQTRTSLEEIQLSSRRNELEHKDALRHTTLLERELEEAHGKREKLEKAIKQMKRDHQSKVDAMTQKYNELKAQNTCKLEALEKEVEASEQFFAKQLEDIMKQHKETLAEVEREHHAAKMEHSMAMEAKKKELEETSYEYETFMDIHIRLEDEHRQLKESHEEALEKISFLENEIELAKKKAHEEKARVDRVVNALSESEAKQKDAAKKSRSALEEAVLQYKKLRTEYELTLKQLEQLQEKLQRETSEAALQYEHLQTQHTAAQKELKALQEKQQRESSDAALQYKKLQTEHKATLRKMDELQERQQRQTSEAFLQYENLRTEHEITLKKFEDLREAHQKERSDTASFQAECEELLNQYEELENKLQEQTSEKHRAMQEAALKYQKLQIEHERTLKKVDYLEKIQHSDSADVTAFKKKYRDALRQCDELKSKLGASETNCINMQKVVFQSKKMIREHEATKKQLLELQLEQQKDKCELVILKEQYEELLSHCEEVEAKVDAEAAEKTRWAVQETFAQYQKLRKEHEVTLRKLRDKHKESSEVEVLQKEYEELLDKCGELETKFDAELQAAENQQPRRETDKGGMSEFFHSEPSLSSGGNPLSTDIETSGALESLLLHQRKQRSVNSAIAGMVSTTCTDNATREEETPPPLRILNFKDFLLHNRRVQRLHNELELSESPDSFSSNETFRNIFLHHQVGIQVFNCDIAQKAGSLPSHITDKAPLASDAVKTVDFLKNELRKVQLVADTSKIRYEAREKELRVVRFQHSKLLKEYQNALKAPSFKSGQDKSLAANELEEQRMDGSCSISTGAKSSQISDSHDRVKEEEVEKLRKSLREAEMKVEKVTLELQGAKKCSVEATNTQKRHQLELRDAMGQFQLHGSTSSATEETQLPLAQRSVASVPSSLLNEGRHPQVAWSTGGAILERALLSCDASTFDLVASFDGSEISSAFGPVGSAEGRDERASQNPPVDGRATTVKYLKLRQEHQTMLTLIEQIRAELEEAKNETKKAKEKHAATEEYLRDMLFQYKKLKNEYNALEARAKSSEGFAGDNKESYFEVVQARDAAKSKVEVIENELERTRREVQAMKKKHTTREEYLHQVLGDYKQLQEDHSKMTNKVEVLKEALRSKKNSHTWKNDVALGEERDTAIKGSNTGRNHKLITERFNIINQDQRNRANKKIKKIFRGIGNLVPPMSPQRPTQPEASRDPPV